MMLPSHFLAAVLLGLLASKWRAFTRQQWALALGFSVAIDLDHLVQVPAYLALHGVRNFSVTAMIHWGHAWQGFMHTPWALALVIPAMLVWRSWVPLVFWGLHMFQDFVIATRFVVFGSLMEWGVVAALLLVVAALLWDDHRRHGSGASFRAHVAGRFGFTRADPLPAS